jgi:hypothetical protein
LLKIVGMFSIFITCCIINVARIEEEPEDEDLRVHQPEFSRQVSSSEQVEIPEELSMNQHGEILLKVRIDIENILIFVC